MKISEAVSEMENFNFNLRMLKYYVDDENIISSIFPPGSRVCDDGKVRVINEKIEEDKLLAPDMRTSKIFGEIGNSISPFIRLTTDYPSKYPSGYMPLLDIQVRMNCMNKV